LSTARAIVRDGTDILGEGPLWSPSEHAIYWVDILGKKVNRVDLDDESVSSWTVPETIGWLVQRRDQPGFVAGLGRRFVALQLDPFGIATIADPEPERATNRLNDAKADYAGRIWAGSMSMEGERPSGAFYRLDCDGTATRVDDGYRIANGPALSPGGDYLVHTDTALRVIYRFEIDDEGALGPRQTFVQFEDDWGHPDGMTFDAEGGLWVACWGGACVRRFAPDGAFDRKIDLPASQITSCTFAGANLDRMFVTSASIGQQGELDGALFEIEPGVRGLPTQMFGG
jgi:xylono-1,5-lactonase